MINSVGWSWLEEEGRIYELQRTKRENGNHASTVLFNSRTGLGEARRLRSRSRRERRGWRVKERRWWKGERMGEEKGRE